MADLTRISTLKELRRAVWDKERELSELDLILADYHAERLRLIRELRRLLAQLREAGEVTPSIPKKEQK